MTIANNDSRRNNIIWILLLCILGGFLIFHTQYSFCMSDEGLYISHVKRLYFGSRMIIDEWGATQFYSPILLPFYSAFRFFTGSDEGVIRFFRIVAVFISSVSSLVFFMEIKNRFGGFVSFCAAALLMVFSRGNIAGTSYYNLNLYFSVLFFAFTRKAMSNHGKKAAVYSVMGGISLSLAVLCQPLSAILYIVLIVCLLANKSTRKSGWGVFGAVLAMGGIYLVLFFFKDNPASYLESIKYVLSNPSSEGVKDSIILILYYHYHIITVPFALLVIILSLWFYFIRRKDRELTGYHLISQAGLVLAMIIRAFVNISEMPCYSVFGFVSIAAFPSFVFCTGKREKRLPVQLYIFGLCLAFIWGLGSNTGFDGMLIGYCISGVGSLLLMVCIIRDDIQSSVIKKLSYTVCSFICVIMLLGSLTQRVFGFYRDAPIDQLDTRIEQGPAKGLITREEAAEQYNEIFQVITDEYAKAPDANVIHMKYAPWAYLCCDWKCYTPSTWGCDISSQWLTDYYSLHGGELPDFVFIHSPETGSFKPNFFNCNAERSNFNQMELTGKLYETLCGDDFREISYKYITEYVKINN